MTLVSQIITDAYRETNFIAEGATESATQQADALRRLISIVEGVLGYDAGKKLLDWPIGFASRAEQDVENSWTANDWIWPVQNSRLVLDHTAPQTIYFPPNPDNGARMAIVDPHNKLATFAITLNGNGRTIDGLASATPTQYTEWLYNARYADWRTVSTLTANAEMPFDPKFDDFFIIKLAARMSPRYGRSLNDLSLMRLSELAAQMESEYNQTEAMPAPTALQKISTPHVLNQGYVNRRGRFGWRP